MAKKNNINKAVTRSAFVRELSNEMAEKRQAEFVISSEAVDTYSTVFKMEGWDLKRYEQNPVVCYQHRAHSNDPDDVIGTSQVFVEGDKLIGRVTFEDAETNPKAEKVFRKIQNGTLKMASISALPTKARMGIEADGEDANVLYFTQQQLLEWSVVTLGSNPEAHKRNAETVDQIVSEVEARDLEVTSPEVVNGDSENRETISVFEAQVLINSNL